jgi:predicted phage terminase large subunit-like protein
MQSQPTCLSREQCDYLLTLPAKELEQWVAALPFRMRGVLQQQLLSHQTLKELAEQSLYEFVRQAWNIIQPATPFIPGWHIEALCQHLEAVTAGRIADLAISIPPGHGKSRLCSVFWPAWTWIHDPSATFFVASYAQELATRDSVDCRYVVESDWYKSNWGDRVRLICDQNQKTKFSTTAHGWRLATSVGGRGLGEHPQYILVDDALNATQASSSIERETCSKWWDSTVASRGLVRGVRRVVIGQRLHVHDLTGHLLERGGFEHICLPYKFEPGRMEPTSLGWNDPRQVPGELLWTAIPDRMKQELDKFPPRVAAAQLQQRPLAEGGMMFRREWFPIVPLLATECWSACRYWDKAGTEGGGDYSAGVLIVAGAGLWFVADVIRGQWSIRQRNAIIEQTAAIDWDRFGENLQIVVEQEPGSAGKESAEFTIRQLGGYRVRADKVTGSKVNRAQPFADQCEAGNVRMVRGTWNQKFLEEAEEFPLGDYLDQIDAAAGAFAFVCRPVPSVFTNRPIMVGFLENGRMQSAKALDGPADEQPAPDPAAAAQRQLQEDLSQLMQDILVADEEEDPWRRASVPCQTIYYQDE